MVSSKKKILFLFAIVFFSLFLVETSSAALQTFPQSQPSTLCRGVRQGDGLPTGATCNITVSYSNGTRLIDFLAMDDLNDQFCRNITADQNALKGIYDYEVTCTDGTLNDTLKSQYLVNLGGVEPTEERTSAVGRTIYIFFGLGILLFISLFFVKKTPIKLTLFLLMIWFILMGINTTYISIQDEVINSNLEGFFSFFLTVSFYLNYAIFTAIGLLWIITFIVSTIERRKVDLIKDYD